MTSTNANAAIIALFGISIAIVPAIADDTFTPPMSFPASPATMPGRAIDVLQLVPGMTVDEVKATLTEMGLVGDIEAPDTSYRVSSRGVTVETTPFVGQVSATTQQGRFTVDFGGPAAAHQAVELTREVEYEDVLTAPTFDSVIEALTAKYGAPSMTKAAGTEGWTPEATLVWAFALKEQVPCVAFSFNAVKLTGTLCPSTGVSYGPSQLQSLAGDTPVHDYAILADVFPSRADGTKVSALRVRVVDFVRATAAAQADASALMDEIERTHTLLSAPIQAPAL